MSEAVTGGAIAHANRAIEHFDHLHIRQSPRPPRPVYEGAFGGVGVVTFWGHRPVMLSIGAEPIADGSSAEADLLLLLAPFPFRRAEEE